MATPLHRARPADCSPVRWTRRLCLHGGQFQRRTVRHLASGSPAV